MLTLTLTLLTPMITVSSNPNPINSTTKYRCEFVNLNSIVNCIFAGFGT